MAWLKGWLPSQVYAEPFINLVELMAFAAHQAERKSATIEPIESDEGLEKLAASLNG